jgi:hypothetical protein
MIRIDEIYCNTFLPIIQDRPWHGIHWFDPFGSVKFEDLRSLPAVDGDDRAVRYLFWDQEPLHKELIDQTLSQYKKMYNGTHHIITSEYASEMVEYVEQQYNFKSHYYFFHGWAALDWFRGYNRSFLMPVPEDRKITKTFIAPNRIIAGQRTHRLEMLYHIFKNGLIDNWISCPSVCPAEHTHIVDAAVAISGRYPDAKEVFAKQKLPLNFPTESGHPMHSYCLSLFDESSESLLYLVNETIATGRRQHLTEKTFKPICLGMPFIIVGTKGSLAYLRKYGFKTFEGIWDESYDQAEDHVRIKQIAGLLSGLDELSVQGKQELFEMCRPIVEHNYNHFYHGGFEKILWTEMKDMIHEL